MTLLRKLQARATELWQGLNLRQRRLLRAAGYSSFGLLTFLMAFSASIPRDRIRDRIERELSQDSSPGLGMDVTIGELGLSFLPLSASLRDVSLKSRPPVVPNPAATDEKPVRSFIESIEVRPAVLGMLLGRRGGRLEVHGFRGELVVEGSVRPGAAKGDGKGPEVCPLDGEVSVDASSITLALIPGLAKVVPLPLLGSLDLKGELKGTLDGRTMSPQPPSLIGELNLSIANCVLGNGKAMLKIPGDPFLSQGLTFPRVELGKVNARIRVDKGRVTFEGVRARSNDAEAALDGYVDLREPLQFSEIHLYLRLKPSAALAGREPKIQMLESALMAGKRPDGFLGLSIQGTGLAPQARPSKDPPPGVSARPLAMGAAPSGAGTSMGAVRTDAPAPSAVIPAAARLPTVPTYVPPPPSQPSTSPPAATPPSQPATTPSPAPVYTPPPPPAPEQPMPRPAPAELPPPPGQGSGVPSGPPPGSAAGGQPPGSAAPPGSPPAGAPPGGEEPTPAPNLPSNMRGE